MPRLQIIVGSTREGRAAEKVIPWVLDRAKRREEFEVELLDLRDWPLPMFMETMATIGDFNDPTYSAPIVKQWNQKIASGDAYIFVTAEYNHSMPGALKNAIDNVFASFAFRNKPAGFIGYSGGNVGGARAVEQLALVAIEAELTPLRNSVLVGGVGNAFDDDGDPKDPATEIALAILLDDLSWWSNLLQKGRADGQHAPAAARRAAYMQNPPIPPKNS